MESITRRAATRLVLVGAALPVVLTPGARASPGRSFDGARGEELHELVASHLRRDGVRAPALAAGC